MNKTTKIILIAVCFMLTATTLASAVIPNKTVFMAQKDPTTWQVVPGGYNGIFATKILVGSVRTPVFTFRGTVAPNTQYTLLSYKEPWPGTGSVVIASGTSSATGELYLAGLLPKLVYNTYISGEYAGQTGAKIWLVLSSDFDTTSKAFTAWQPTQYLFETNLYW